MGRLKSNIFHYFGIFALLIQFARLSFQIIAQILFIYSNYPPKKQDYLEIYYLRSILGPIICQLIFILTLLGLGFCFKVGGVAPVSLKLKTKSPIRLKYIL